MLWLYENVAVELVLGDPIYHIVQLTTLELVKRLSFKVGLFL